MRNTSTPRHVREADARTVDPSPDTAAVRAEDVQPRGYHALRVAEPPAAELVGVAESLGALALCADLIRMPAADPEHSQRVAALISLEARRLAGVLRFLAAGAAVVALLAVGLVVAPFGSTPAQAGTTVPTVRVVLDRPSRTVRVPATAYGTTPDGWHCASVWLAVPGLPTGPGILGRACSRYPFLAVPVPVTAARFGSGGSFRLVVVDDADPLAALPVPMTLLVLRPSRIFGSYVADGGGGRLFVAVALQHRLPTTGAWMGSRYSPVSVQVATRRGWRTRGTVTTDGNGYASGYVATGAGTFLVRLVRPQGGTVTGVTGPAELVTVTAMAVDFM